MRADELPSQLHPYNELRKELEGKIDKKLDAHVFYWFVGIPLIVVLLALFGAAFNLIFKYNEQNHELKESLVRLEVKLDSLKK